MNIFNHLIPNSAILGIGPLTSETQEVKTADFQFIKIMRFSFHLHLVAHTTVIYSKWFEEEKNKDYADEILDWRQEYFSLRDRISELMGEPTDSRIQHVQHAEELHKKIQENFNDLLAQVEPTEGVNTVTVHARIQRILTEVEDLKKLALC